MTTKQRGYQISLLRRLHTAPRYLALYAEDPIAYRAWLKKHLRVDSSKELSLEKLIELVAYMEMKRETVPTNHASAQQIAYLHHLWSQRAKTPTLEALLSFAHRVLKYHPEDTETLSPTEVSRLIAAVKGIKPQPRASFDKGGFRPDLIVLDDICANNPHYQGGN